MILQKTSQLGYLPKRIISLVPSQTELLFHLGLETETIGITKFCVHPSQWFKNKERVGGTKTLNIERIRRLNPDLIIANKEETVKEQVEQLAADYPVWLTDINNLNDALKMVAEVGTLTGKDEHAVSLVKQIKGAFKGLKKAPVQLRTAYLIWQKPFMTIGGDTFINDMLQQCGLKNIFADKERYPQISITELQDADCELLLLSSEPFPFKQKHVDELKALLPQTNIVLVDGELFSWYGSRLLKSPGYFNKLIHSIGQLN
jgi:ABC-type Fe3+-hydroxamate transport system substrate-binding protein